MPPPMPPPCHAHVQVSAASALERAGETAHALACSDAAQVALQDED